MGSLARDAYSLGHFPMLVGIIGFAAAIEQLVSHPGDPLPGAVVVALGAGIGLFVGFSAFAYWRLSGRILMPRLALLGAMLLGLAVVAPLAPVWPLAVVAAALLAIVVIEAVRPGAPSSSSEA
jgi:low temperature requirement protein LtrA